MCPAQIATAWGLGSDRNNQGRGSNTYVLRPERGGATNCRFGVGYSRASTIVGNSPVCHKLGSQASPSLFAWACEFGWEPYGQNDWEKHCSTPYSRFWSSNGEHLLDGLSVFGHRDGWTVPFLDGHVAHKAHKRTHWWSSAFNKYPEMENKAYMNCIISTLD